MCTSTIQNFLNQRFYYQSYSYTTVQLAQWVSYQTLLSPNPGVLSVAVIVAQWGNESGYGGVDISQYYNPGNQGSTCGKPQCGTYAGGLPAFCNIRDGVQSYAALLTNGYPHVQHAFNDNGWGENGMVQACTALGQGYEAGQVLKAGYCGGPAYVSASSPRIWAASEYNDGNGPGSSLYDTINANDCLYNLNYVQESNPNLPGF